MSDKLEIVVWDHNTSAEFRCGLCGGWYEQNHVAASIVPVGADVGIIEDIEALAEVCPDCLDAGTDDAAARARWHAQLLRAQASQFDELADAVETKVVKWASSEDIRRVERAVEANMRGEPLAGDAEPVPTQWVTDDEVPF
jgi:hypothetical protein